MAAYTATAPRPGGGSPSGGLWPRCASDPLRAARAAPSAVWSIVLVNESYQLLCPTCVTPSVRHEILKNQPLSRNSGGAEHLSRNSRGAEHLSRNSRGAENLSRNSRGEVQSRNSRRVEHLSRNSRRVEHLSRNSRGVEDLSRNSRGGQRSCMIASRKRL